MSDQTYRVCYRTEAGRVGAVLLVATSPAEAVDKLRSRDSLMLNAPRVVATATN